MTEIKPLSADRLMAQVQDGLILILDIEESFAPAMQGKPIQPLMILDASSACVLIRELAECLKKMQA
jgi:hypothetical protein